MNENYMLDSIPPAQRLAEDDDTVARESMLGDSEEEDYDE